MGIQLLNTMHSQYLNPDFMSPLPSSMDIKESPLALLAQTCSAIGKDPDDAKANNNNKKDSGRDSVGGKSDTSKSVSPDTAKDRNSNSERSNTISPSSEKPGFRVPTQQKEIPPLVPIANESRSPQPETKDLDKTSVREDGRRPSSRHSTDSPTPVSGSRLSHSASSMLGSTSERAPPQSTALPPSLKHDPLATALPPSLYPGYPGLPYLGYPLPSMDPTNPSAHLHHPSLTAAGALALGSHHKLPTGHLPGPHGLSPFAYTRMKTASGASTLVPVCKDPYCANCLAMAQSTHLGAHHATCPTGCTQCPSDKPYPHSVSSALSASALSSTLPASALHSASSLSATAHLSSLYGHAFGVVPGQHSSPYVCNWVSGSDYCGKRFTTSEELFHHLRTHTSAADAHLPPGVAGFPTLSGLTPAALAAAHASSYPGSLSPTSLRHAYPRSLSPGSLLAASRYHPYKSPFSALPPPPSSTLPGLSGSLPPYYSPYAAALYSQRLGAAAAP